MKAVIMCGGIGSRLKPLTESQPKPLLKLLNRPVIDIVIEHLIKYGISDIYISLGFMSDDIISYCESRQYDANIIFKEEKIPLGTAGGVKNCIPQSDDDILIVSGDNVFDFNLEKICDFHYSSDSHITVCGVYVDDPREYGVIIKDEDGSICSFIEKPTWENAQSFLVNTGIYLMKGDILEKIPENEYYDFSDDLFPEIFKTESRFMCYEAEGFWGDMGEFPAYLEVTKSILDGKYKNFRFEGTYISEDTFYENEVEIKAPVLLGKNVKLNKNTVIGPYTVIGDDSSIGENSVVSGAVIGNSCKIAGNCEIKSIITSDMINISDNCSAEELSVFGYGCNIGRFSRILKFTRIWPGRRINKESIVSKDMLYETPVEVNFDIFGISGNINSQFSITDAAQLGQAIASVKNGMKIGIGSDEKISSSVYRNACSSGIRTCGGTVYDFGHCAKVQSYFYSAYCNLDAFIFISSDSDVISFSFYGENGMPIDGKTARKINNIYKFSAYNYCSADGYREMYNMALFLTVYKTYFNKILGDKMLPVKIIAESDNLLLKSMLNEIFAKKGNLSSADSIQLLINNDGTDIYIVEKEKFYSSERILLFLCEMAFAGNRDVIIPEDAPSLIEEKSAFYGRNAIRQFAGARSGLRYSNDIVLDNIWCFDPVLMVARLLNVLCESGETLEQLFEYQSDFTLRKSIINFDGMPGKIRDIFESSGAYKYDDGYYMLNNRKGRIRMRQLGNSSRIRVLAEAADMEAAKELSVFVAEKIKNANIDKV